jgi:hypothetical protein
MRVRYLLAILVSSACSVFADIVVFPADESKLPFQFSPKNFSLSSSNFDNSISNYDNSPSNYDNSPSNYDNSPSNFENTVSGDRSVLVEEGSKFIHYGYYVTNSGGVTNFYSTKGKRIFYSPKNSMGVYHGTKGFFCGVMARVEGKLRLVLTEQGVRALLLPE